MWQPKTERCAFLVDNLDLAEATGFDGARWEFFQLQHLQDDSTFRNEVKSRQIAWSWLCAAEAVADGILEGVGSVFVSINLDEAKEKIRYAKNIAAALPPKMRPKLITDNRLEIEFANGARLMSLPSTAPRGKAQMNVYLDEFAHVRDAAIIYTAALPMITKGKRRLRMGSSPMGAGGRFWEVATESMRPYPGYTRARTPWWEVQAFCTNVRAARQMAPSMATADRVAMFGNERIQAIFANMPLEDFQQEYECEFVDETTAWITWDEIRDAQDPELLCFLATCRGKDIDQAMAAVDSLARAIAKGQAEVLLSAGVDIGRTRNTTELFVTGITPDRRFPLRLAITLDAAEFSVQEDVLIYALERLPILGMLLDQTGLGRNLAENVAKRFPGRAAGVDFTNQSKTVWATDAKMLIQQHKTPLPVDRDIAYQIHSIKRTVTATKLLSFDTTRNEKHHADKFWGWALSLAAAMVLLAEPAKTEQVVVDDERVEISPY